MLPSLIDLAVVDSASEIRSVLLRFGSRDPTLVDSFWGTRPLFKLHPLFLARRLTYSRRRLWPGSGGRGHRRSSATGQCIYDCWPRTTSYHWRRWYHIALRRHFQRNSSNLSCRGPSLVRSYGFTCELSRPELRSSCVSQRRPVREKNEQRNARSSGGKKHQGRRQHRGDKAHCLFFFMYILKIHCSHPTIYRLYVNAVLSTAVAPRNVKSLDDHHSCNK